MDPLTIETITNQVMYSVGETILVIGIFISLVGAVTMIYSISEKQFLFNV